MHCMRMCMCPCPCVHACGCAAYTLSRLLIKENSRSWLLGNKGVRHSLWLVTRGARGEALSSVWDCRAPQAGQGPPAPSDLSLCICPKVHMGLESSPGLEPGPGTQVHLAALLQVRYKRNAATVKQRLLRSHGGKLNHRSTREKARCH